MRLARAAASRCRLAPARLFSVAHNKIVVDSPFSGEVVAEVPLASQKEADVVVTKSQAAQKQWKASAFSDRVAVCEQFIKNVEANRDVIAKVGSSWPSQRRLPTLPLHDCSVCARPLAQEISLQMGKPLSQAYGEINGMKDRTQALIAMAPKALETVTFPEANGIQKRIVKEPVGVVLTIAPWNYPLLTSVNSST